MIGLFLEKIEWLEVLYDIIENEPEFEMLKPDHSYSSSTYLTYNFNNKSLLSVVTQGAPVTIATIELLGNKYNFNYIFRIGTTGSFQEDLNIGDIVIPTGAIVGEGTSKGYVPPGYPSIPDYNLSGTMFDHFSNKFNTRYGIIYTVDAAFSNSKFSGNIDYKLLEDIHCLGVDMETSAFFNVCSIKKIPAASLQIVSDSPNYPTKNNTEDYIEKVHKKIPSILTELLYLITSLEVVNEYEVNK